MNPWPIGQHTRRIVIHPARSRAAPLGLGNGLGRETIIMSGLRRLGNYGARLGYKPVAPTALTEWPPLLSLRFPSPLFITVSLNTFCLKHVLTSIYPFPRPWAHWLRWKQ
jgi:hypothetical protein